MSIPTWGLPSPFATDVKNGFRADKNVMITRSVIAIATSIGRAVVPVCAGGETSVGALPTAGCRSALMGILIGREFYSDLRLYKITACRPPEVETPPPITSLPK